MGLSSSQARLLNLTSRMHQIEYKAAKIEAEKLQMANKSKRVYQEYQNALERTKIQYKSITSDGSATFLDATLAIIENHGISTYSGVTASKVFLLQNAETNEIYVTSDFAQAHGINNDGLAPDPGPWEEYLENSGLPRQDNVVHYNGIYNLIDNNTKTIYCPSLQRTIQNFEDYNNFLRHCTGTTIPSLITGIDYVSIIGSMTTEDLAHLNGYIEYKQQDTEYNVSDIMSFVAVILALEISPTFNENPTNEGTTISFNDSEYNPKNQNYSDYLILRDGDIDPRIQVYDPDDYNALLKEWQEKKALFDANVYYVIVDDELATNKDFLNNHLTTNQSILIDWELYSKGEECSETSVATNTFFQEVDDEKELRKAEAKYEADMRQIDMKDRKFDYDLAALDAERNAVKQEMETLKTVAKDNVDRTFKLFG